MRDQTKIRPENIANPAQVLQLKNIRQQYKFSKSEENIDKKTASCKTEPNTPKRSPKSEAVETEADVEGALDMRALSMESLLIGGISRYCRTRRLKSSHAGSREGMWLPGRSTRATSFNSFCSGKFCRDEELRERSVGSYYYTRVLTSSSCSHAGKYK